MPKSKMYLSEFRELAKTEEELKKSLDRERALSRELTKLKKERETFLFEKFRDDESKIIVKKRVYVQESLEESPEEVSNLICNQFYTFLKNYYPTSPKDYSSNKASVLGFVQNLKERNFIDEKKLFSNKVSFF